MAVPYEWELIYDLYTGKTICGDGHSSVQELVKCDGHVVPEKVTKVINKVKPADINEDGKVDEEDLSLVHTEYAKEIKAKKSTPKKKASAKKKGK